MWWVVFVMVGGMSRACRKGMWVHVCTIHAHMFDSMCVHVHVCEFVCVCVCVLFFGRGSLQALCAEVS